MPQDFDFIPEKKYFLTSENKPFNGYTLRRICALKDFADVRAGEKGGWVESEDNLSHNGHCWVYDDAVVMGDARVAQHARVLDNAVVSGKACIHGFADITKHAEVSGVAVVCGDALVTDNAVVCGDALVKDCAVLAYARIGNGADVEKPGDYVVTGPMKGTMDFMTTYKGRNGKLMEMVKRKETGKYEAKECNCMWDYEEEED